MNGRERVNVKDADDNLSNAESVTVPAVEQLGLFDEADSDDDTLDEVEELPLTET